MKKIVVAMVLPWLVQAQDIGELFTKLKAHPQTQADILLVKKSELTKDKVDASLYPKISLFASFNHYTDATGMVPVPPSKLAGMKSQPFSDNISKLGAKVSMALFKKSIYTSAKKASAMQKSAESKREIDILKNEALIVGANANFLYLVSLTKALDGQEKSLLETKKTLQIKVNNGRSPASALYKIDDSLNEIAIAKNSIALEERKIISNIESVTGVELQKPIPMKEVVSFTQGEFSSLDGLKYKIEADKIELQIQKEQLYPSLFLNGTYFYSQAKAYNTNKNIDESYGDIGIVLNIPLFEMQQYSEISLADISLQSSKIELKKMKEELQSSAKMLESSLALLTNSLKLYKYSIENKKKLLAIAKVNFNNGRLSTEEYLRYEDAVVVQEANLYKTEATKWQTVMNLAVIYGNNIEEMVK